jgi:hypothetical protein
MSKLDDVRALFVSGEKVRMVENTYHRAGGRTEMIGRVWTVGNVGKSVWTPIDPNPRGVVSGYRGTFPTRVRDVLSVDDHSATWLIGRGDHTVTYERVS